MENAQRFYLTLINVFVVIAAMAVIVALIMLLDPSRESTTLIAMLSLIVGSFITQNTNSQQWWFGTNKGTSDTTAVIRDIATGRPPPTNPDVPTTDPTATPPPMTAPPKSEFAQHKVTP